ADDALFRRDREYEGAAHACVAVDCGMQRALVRERVDRPQWLSALPDASGKGDAGPENCAALAFDETLERGPRPAPVFAEAQHSSRLVDAEIAPAFPSLRFDEPAGVLRFSEYWSRPG